MSKRCTKFVNGSVILRECGVLEFGIGNNFNRGQQVDYVLGTWDSEEKALLPEKIDRAIQMIKSFGTVGTAQTMNQFNNK
jgi:PTH1 family peptidyl-tRNA hydrolase